jgi:nucleoside-diphosphate-sugar epimerase
MTTVLITGAAGNLGSLLARHIRDHADDLDLVLMQHRTAVPADIGQHPGFRVRKADLSRPETLTGCVEGVDTIVHFAGVLFKADPETFLPETNTRYFRNLIGAATANRINRVLLISFPHVEGPSTRQRPATGRLVGRPVSVHARTRLEEERLLFSAVERPVSLRVGMVYGRGILMIDAARWLARRRLLAVWRAPTEIHLISKTDFCRSVVAALRNETAGGVYHVGDDGNDTLQSFLDLACDLWGCPRPLRLPIGIIYLAADLTELASKVLGTASPLTRDFIDIGRVSYHGDTGRFRKELLPELTYPDIISGIEELIG